MGERMESTPRGQITTQQTLLMILIFFATTLNYVDRQVLALLKPTLEAEFHWSDSDFSNLGVAFQLSAMFTLVLVGWFVDRFGVRFAYGAAVAFWSLAGIGHAISRTIPQFVIARISLSVAESVNTPAAVKASAIYMPLTARSISLGIVNTAPNIGAIITPLVIPAFAVAYGWHAAFVVTGSLGFVWLAFWIMGTRKLVPIVPVQRGSRPNVDWRDLLSDRRTWTVAGAKALTDQVWWFMLLWMPDFFSKVFHLSQARLGGPTAVAFMMAALGAVTSGFLFPVLLRLGLGINGARKLSMLLYGCLILPLPFALYVASPWTAALLIGLGLFAHQGFSTNVFGLTADIVPAQRVGSVMAVGGIAGNLTGAGILKLTGWLLDAKVGYWPIFALASVSYLLATLFVHLMLPVIKAAPTEAST